MSESFFKRFWLTHAPHLMLTYWIGVTVFCFFTRPDSIFVATQIACSMALLFGGMVGYHNGVKDCAAETLKRMQDMERDYIITFTRRNKDE